ncbi:MAG: membrane protein insertase YidC [Treponema sp.]|jgi:YidC/Oxa1 family membrane protein insertase|nr:membrane protein insertase YidC [Treponema sp.]
MEKRTVIAVVLSMAVIFGFYLIMGAIYPQTPAAPAPAAAEPSQAQTSPAPSQELVRSENVPAPPAAAVAPESGSGEPLPEPPVIIDTNLMTVTLTNAGGDITSLRLKEHKEKGNTPVEMIFSGSSQAHAFSVSFGNEEDLLAGRIRPESSYFRVRKVSDLIVEFSRDFNVSGGGTFTLTKRYEFKKDDYLFQLDVIMDGGYTVNGFNFGGASYTLAFGPQIGPKFEKLDQRYEYRHYLSYKGKLKTEKVNDRSTTVITTQPSWAAIAGKYFTLIALPYANQYNIAFSSVPEADLPAASRLLITRPATGGSRIEDKYQFYLGPKNQEVLKRYNNADNPWKLSNTGLIEAANTRGFLAPLETLLKWLLVFFNNIVNNYGIAILLLTVLVKLVMFPLTRKSSESTMRMQALAPKIKEIQEKYRDNPTKMNQEMAGFYKKEGYNPMSGCLPMIIQIPIFFAMYNLFNNHFDLRGAMFIPGWIPDLSLPESVFNFSPFKVPFLGWSDIRLLPFLYVGSQLLYGKVTQTPDQKGNSQMKMMLYAMPIVFFFILYDVPSGLLLYWIMSNVLTMVQQLIINKYIAKKRALAPVDSPQPVIVPKKKRRK